MSDWRLFGKPETSHRVRINESKVRLEAEREELKRQSLTLIEKTNRTFRELTSTLSREESKLSQLEDRRRRLLDEMMNLKADIEKEKIACRLDLEATANGDEDSLDSWMTEDEVEKKPRISYTIPESNTSKKLYDIENNDSRKSSVEIADDIINQLEVLSRRGNNY